MPFKIYRSFVEVDFSLEQSCLFIEDKLSSTAVDFIRSEGIAERQHLIWGKASSLSMPRTYNYLNSQVNTPQATPHSYSLRSTLAGQASNTTRASRQGNRCPPNHRSTQASQEVNTTSQEGNTSISPPSRPPQGSSKEEPNPKWVINLSNKPLTPAKKSVLAKGPNFVVTPRQPPNLEYITVIEAACTKLSQQDERNLGLISIES